MKNFDLEKRRYVLSAIASLIIVVYIIRLFSLQIASDDYRKSADSNAFLKKIEFPSRGTITDRNGKLLVYNQPAYDIMVVMNEEAGRLDTMDFCNALGITKEFFKKRMAEIKDRSKNPGYSRFTQQLFMGQLPDKEFSAFQEKIFRFPGFYIQRRSIRQYKEPLAAHLLGDVAEVSQGDIEEDDYYQPGDYIGKQGIERQYEKDLRGRKGVQILLRDARGRIKGRYKNGQFDQKPLPGKDIQLGLDAELQKLGERLMEGKLGAIVAIEPKTGQILDGVIADFRSQDHDRQTARKESGTTDARPCQTAHQQSHRRTISTGKYIQNDTGRELLYRGYRQRLHSLSLRPRILLQGTPRRLPLPRGSYLAHPGHQHVVQ